MRYYYTSLDMNIHVGAIMRAQGGYYARVLSVDDKIFTVTSVGPRPPCDAILEIVPGWLSCVFSLR